MAQLRIHPLPLLKIPLSPVKMVYSVDIAEPSEIYAYIWYIEGTKERILVDAGASVETCASQGVPAEHIASPSKALKKVGITPDEVDLVIYTHLHIDHAELGQLYKNARFIVQKAELEAAFNPHPIEAPPYVSKSALDGLDFEVINGDTQVVEGVRILSTPGHSRGGQSPLVDTERGKVIISGLCTIRSNFEPPETVAKSMPVIPPWLHLDVREAYDSLMRIKDEADIIFPLHDAEFALRDTDTFP
jgi:N-acyl homoserine lactone hydrolase